MDFSDFLEKIGQNDQSSEDSEFSVSRALSLPLDFLVSFVRNRREAELLLRVSKSAASLDLLTHNFEMIACRAQILQETWNGLWCAQEPYVVPAIPLIGFKMSGVNGGRMMLLGKMHNEIVTLQELGNQLCHHIDVNHSLVEELRMEGIERLATNKLLLVEVEREVTRRITHICSNKSVRDLSSMHQFLLQLRPTTTSTVMPSTAEDESMDHVDSTTNGSCSTQKVTTDGSSEAHQRSLEAFSKDIDTVSPDSQSFASKCIATQGENMHPSSNIRHIDLISTKMPNCQQSCSDPISIPGKDIPSVLQAGDGHDELPRGVGCFTEKCQEHGNKTGAEKQVVESRSQMFLLDAEVQLAVNSSRVLLNESGKKVSSSAEKGASLDVELTREAAQVDFMVSGASNVLAPDDLNFKAVEISAGLGLCKPLEMGQMSKFCTRGFQSARLDFSRKRQAECGGNSGEMIDIAARKLKRAKVQALFEFTKAGTHTSKDSFMTQSMHLKQESCSIGSDDNTVEGQGEDVTINRQLGFMPCSCDEQNIDAINTHSATDSKPSVHARCNGCGGLLSKKQADQISSEQAPTNAGCVLESPIPATQ